MGYFDPRSRTDADYQRDVDNGKYDAFRRSDAGVFTNTRLHQVVQL